MRSNIDTAAGSFDSHLKNTAAALLIGFPCLFVPPQTLNEIDGPVSISFLFKECEGSPIP
jgi:hypothetical protein